MLRTRAGRATAEAPGSLVEVDGAPMHVLVGGRGSPTVVFESGAGGSVLEWTSIAKALESEVVTFRRDRFGLGWSPYAERSRDAASLGRQLREALRAAGVPGPFVLVGHSLGALVVRSFAATYPDEVAGVVLVDGTPGEFTAATPKLQRMLRAQAALVGALVSLRRFGGAALHRRLELRMMPADARPENTSEVRALLRTLHQVGPDRGLAVRAEFRDLLASCTQMVGLPMPPVPLRVISQGRPSRNARMVAFTDDLRRQHAQQARELSPHGVHVVAGRSGHLVPIDQPEIVVSAVREVIAAHRSGKNSSAGS